MWVSAVGRENLQVSHGFTHSSKFPTRPIDWPASAHTYQNSLFIFSQCTHTHPHCPVPTSLDSVMTGNNSTINDAIDKWGPWPVDSTYQKGPQTPTVAILIVG